MDMTGAVPAGPSDNQVVQSVGSDVVPGSQVLRILIQLYLEGRSDVAQDYERFVAFIRGQLGSLESLWVFDETEPPRLVDPDERFPLVQACVRFRHEEGAGNNDDIFNFMHMITAERDAEFPGNTCNSVLLLCQKLGGPEASPLVLGKLFSGFANTEWPQEINFANRSFWDDVSGAFKEVACNIFGAVKLAKAAYKVASHFRYSTQNNAWFSTAFFSHPAFHAPGQEGFFTFVDQVPIFLDPLPNHAQPEDISIGRQNLDEALGRLGESFQGANTWVQTQQLGEFRHISVERTIHIAQLLEDMSGPMEMTIRRSRELNSLHAAKYTTKKRNAHGLVATTGCVVAVGIALLSPWGWPVLWAAGAALVKANLGVAAGIAAGGAVTSTLCGSDAFTNHKECTRRNRMNDSYASLSRSKYRLLVVMTYILLGNSSQSGTFRSNLCQRMGVGFEDVEKVGQVQTSFESYGNYWMGQLQARWEEFREHFEEFQQSVADMSM